MLLRLMTRSAELLDRAVGWPRLPRLLALSVLIGLRSRLLARNLYDSGRIPGDKPPFENPAGIDNLRARTLNGTHNDRHDPLMGSIGCPFGRNVPMPHAYPEQPAQLMDPSPRLVSQRLLTREYFQPATTLNLLAAAWIQFEVHDWFSHYIDEKSQPWDIPLDDHDPWENPPMTIKRTPAGPSPDRSSPPTYLTNDTHWWDGSQIYGNTLAFAEALRGEKGQLKIDKQGLIPRDVEKLLDPRVAPNFWVGLSILHSLFMREHNAICRRLASLYPQMSDQELYDKARLINAALMAKIHTVDWTPAIIAHPTTVLGMHVNWFGLLGERFNRRFGRITDNEWLQGIPGSPTNQHGVPYSLTEEFVAVYRMHQLIPDTFFFRSMDDDCVVREHEFPDLDAEHVRQRLDEMPMADIFYSFGRSHPGAITLHNYPKHLRCIQRDGGPLDLATADILRVRERGVPRYNEFRKLFRLKPASSFEELTDNPIWAGELKQVYGDVDRVDLLIGLYAEPKPKGFGFSDTAFRVFLLMASRRLESDRFFTDDFRPEIYTQAGMDWISKNTMRTVLLRHFPVLAPALEGVKNPFAPWRPVGPNNRERTHAR
jgi:Animal haem peroxidase